MRYARRGGLTVPGAAVGAVALGGAAGTAARYGVALLVDVTPGAFPWGTFWTNITGSFALGFVAVLLAARFPGDRARHLRPLVTTGFLGAFTTYSTFAVETDLLARNGHAGTAALYAVASPLAGFAAVAAGMALARTARAGPGEEHRVGRPT